MARYVGVQHRGDARGRRLYPLILCQVQVYEEAPRDWALGRPALQSSTNQMYNASYALDPPAYFQCRNSGLSRTKVEAAPWWQVDLGAIVQVSAVNVTAGRDHGFYGRVWLTTQTWRVGSSRPWDSADGGPQLCDTECLVPDQDSHVFTCRDGLLASHVAVEHSRHPQGNASYSLVLCHVQVFGHVPVNRAVGKEATQESTEGSQTADLALKQKSISLPCASTSFSMTRRGMRPWWRVDLQGIFSLKAIIVRVNHGGPYSIEISDTLDQYQTCQQTNLTGDTIEKVTCPPSVQARHVRIVREAMNTSLGICQLRVYGDCAAGFYGANCNTSCPDKCNSVCSPSDGQCSSCMKGYWGQKCGRTCPETCGGQWKPCNQQSGNCDSCPDTRYGSKCEHNCSENCQDRKCARHDGTCIRCVDGFYGTDCQSRCSSSCASKICNRSTGHCNNCVVGTYGTTCQHNCSDGCSGKNCSRSNGHCFSCIKGKYGNKCENDCPKTCLGNDCNQTGHCNGCVTGRHGTACQLNCPEHCADDGPCEQLTGNCDGCDRGFHGRQCRQSCPQNCASCQNSSYCDRCKSEYYGRTCEETCGACVDTACDKNSGHCEACTEGYFGSKCYQNCTETCENGCEKDTGICKNCSLQAYGRFCKKKCPSNCTDGCNRYSGNCVSCIRGYYGDVCNQTCSPTCLKGCNQNDGKCSSCVEEWYGDFCTERCGRGCSSSCEMDGTCICKAGFQPPTCHVEVSTERTGGAGGALAGGVAGGVVVLLIALAVVVVIILLRKGKLPVKTTTDQTQAVEIHVEQYQNAMFVQEDQAAFLDAANTYDNTGLSVRRLPDYVQRMRNNAESLEKEYNGMTKDPLYDWTYGKQASLAVKNRFKNVVPYDNNRVWLINGRDGDYINASYIDSYSKKRAFIAAQGPNPRSLEDFILMLWEQNVPLVVMVTNLKEENKTKCEKYWPELQETTIYGDIKLTLEDEEKSTHITLRSLKLEKMGEVRLISQLQFTSWPDHGVPASPSAFLTFLSTAQSLYDIDQGPTVVHCSAGIGRTGTYLAMEILLAQAAAEDRLTIPETVIALRKQRVSMVQSLDQYTFLHECLLVALHCNQTSRSTTTFQGECDGIRDETLQKEFQILEKLDILPKADQVAYAQTQENAQKNRNMQVLPRSTDRPFLMTSVPGRNDYINAVFVKGYKKKDEMIVTQSPLPETLIDFWRLVHDYKINTIVALNKISSKDCPRYWNTETGGMGPFHVQLTAEVGRQGYSCRTLRYKLRTERREVQHYEVVQWPANGDLPRPSLLLGILGEIDSHGRSVTDGRVLIHCLHGYERSGLFCALTYICQQITQEQEVNVFEAVRQTRPSRVQFVPSFKQYRWLYQAARDYVNSFDTYANFK